MDIDRVEKLWSSAVRVILPLNMVLYKYEKYGVRHRNITYYWAGGYLFTVANGRVLISIHKQDRKEVKLA